MLVLGGVWAFSQAMSPKLFVATVRMQLDVPANSTGPSPVPYDPYYLQTDFEIIRSHSQLVQAVEQAGLEKKWSTAGALPLSRQEAVMRLRERLRVSQIRNTSLIQLEVAAPESVQAADLANAVAFAYIQQRQDRFTSRSMQRYRMLHEEAKAREEKVISARKSLAKYQVENPKKPSDDSVPRTKESLLQKRVELSQEAHDSIVRQMQEADFASKSQLQDVTIIDRAEPPLKARRWRPARD